MERVTMSDDGRIEIPQSVREALKLAGGTAFDVEVNGPQIVLSTHADWRSLRGMAADGPDLIDAYVRMKEEDKELEDKHP